MVNTGDVKTKYDNSKKAYEKKDVEYFITNNYRIFKLNEIADNFNITAKYRVKRSGSTHVGSARMNGVKKYIADNFGITDTRTDGKKLFARTNRDIDKVRFNPRSFVAKDFPHHRIGNKGHTETIVIKADAFFGKLVDMHGDRWI